MTNNPNHLAFNEYQRRAMTTAIYPENAAVVYPALGLASEAGEFAGKVKKIIRDSNVPSNEELAAELGDVLWYIAACANDLNLTLGDIALGNLSKLEKRAKSGTLGGSGDNR